MLKRPGWQLVFAAVWFTGFGCVCCGAPPEPTTPARTDPFGEPLPVGAIARLGVVRFLYGSKLAFTPDAKQIIVVTNDGLVRTLEAANGRTIRRHQLPVSDYAADLSREGQRVLTVGKSDVSVWDVTRGARLFMLPQSHDWQLAKASLAPDGKTIATVRVRNIGGNSTKAWSIWDVANAKERLLETTNEPCDTHLLSFSPNGKRLLTHVPGKHGFRCWDLEHGKEAWRSEKQLHRVTFTPDSRTLLGCYSGSDWWSLDVVTGKPVAHLKLPRGSPHSALLIAPDNRTLCLPLRDGVVLWDLIAGKEIRKLPGTSTETSFGDRIPGVFAPDGRSVLTNFGMLQHWELATGKPLYADTSHLGHTGHPWRLTWSPDGKFLVSASYFDHTVRVWDVASRTIRHNLVGHTSYVRVVKFTADSQRIVTAGGDSTVRIWDTTTGKELRCIRLHEQQKLEYPQQVLALHVSPDGLRLTALGAAQIRNHVDNVLSVLDSQSGTRIEQRRILATEDLNGGHLLPNPKLLLGWSGRLLDVTTGRWTNIVPQLGADSPSGPCWLAADGRLAAAELHVANPIEMIVWEVASGLPVARLPTGKFESANFDSSRPFVVTAGTQLHLWDLRSGRAALSHPAWIGHRGGSSGRGMHALAVEPAGRMIASGQSDGSILLWDAAVRDPVDHRPLTDRECQSLWTDLAGTDATRAFAAVWRFAGDSPRAVRFLTEKLRPAAPPDLAVIQALVKDLDDANFNRRQGAEKRLRDQGEVAAPALRVALNAKLSAEARKRLSAILTDFETLKALLGEPLRQHRAVWMLELAGTPEAKTLLEALAKGADAPITREAKNTLERWRR